MALFLHPTHIFKHFRSVIGGDFTVFDAFFYAINFVQNIPIFIAGNDTFILLLPCSFIGSASLDKIRWLIFCVSFVSMRADFTARSAFFVIWSRSVTIFFISGRCNQKELFTPFASVQTSDKGKVGSL